MSVPRLSKGVFFALIVLVLWLALTPQPPHAMDTGWDKLNHALAFGALALSGRFGFPGSRLRAFAVAIALIAFGAAIEWLQSYVPTRSSELNDLVADLVGIVVGLLAAALATRHLSSKTLQSVWSKRGSSK